jgi:murein DD-endopeptidase MepM/ murein hydrolase activator NlpD
MWRVRHDVIVATGFAVLAGWGCSASSAPPPTGPLASTGGFCSSQSFTPAAESPYVLPYVIGTTQIMFQGNCSTLGGHRDTFAYDFDLPMGTVVVASRAGTVTFTNDQYADTDHVSGHENNVFIRHDDGTVIRYTHLRQGGVTVSVGQQVLPGSPLGFSGNSGASTSPHLHLQAFLDGTSFNAPNSVPLTFRNAEGALRPTGELIEGQSYRAR